MRWLQERGISIWDEWADAEGNLGPVYGYQWRSWPTPSGEHIDQIARVVSSIRTYPDSRRHIVSAWNVADVDSMALPPCHALFQFYVAPPKRSGDPARLSCQPATSGRPTCSSACRSTSPPTRCSTMMVAQVCHLAPGEFVHTLGDAHLYLNHLDQARLQLTRDPRPLPQMRIAPRTALDEFELEDFELGGGDHAYPSIKAPIAV